MNHLINIGGNDFAKGQIMKGFKLGQLHLSQVPIEERDDTLCRTALRYLDDAWFYIPEHFKRFDNLVHWIATGQSGTNKMYGHLPKEIQTVDFLKQVILKNPRCYPLVQTLLPTLSDTDIDFFLNHSPELFRRLNKTQQTYQRCTLAVKHNPYQLESLPEHCIDTEMLQVAIRSGVCISLIPKKMKNNELAKFILEHHPLLMPQDIREIPEELFTQSIVEDLVARHPTALGAIPSRFITVEMCIKALDGREFMGFELTHMLSNIPESMLEEVKEKADWIYHVQPGEL